MSRNYLGFCLREHEEETGIFFKRKVKKEVFGRLSVEADDFAEAQKMLCDNMTKRNITVGIITPYWKKVEDK